MKTTIVEQTPEPAAKWVCAPTAAVELPQKEPDWEELKLALNNAVWMHAPGGLTLTQAEEATMRAMAYISECYRKLSEGAAP